MFATPLESSHPAPEAASRAGEQYDAVDYKLLTLLHQAGRTSFTQLAEQVGLSLSTVHSRVRRLEERGIIKGYHADIDVSVLGRPLTAFVSIAALETEPSADIPELLAHISQIEACHSVTGAESYLLQVRVTSPNALEELLTEIRRAVKVTTHTKVVLTTYFNNRALL